MSIGLEATINSSTTFNYYRSSEAPLDSESEPNKLSNKCVNKLPKSSLRDKSNSFLILPVSEKVFIKTELTKSNNILRSQLTEKYYFIYITF